MATTHKAVITQQQALTITNDTTFTGGGSNAQTVGSPITLTDTSTPTVTEECVTLVTLVAGVFTLDLTAVAATDGRTVNFTGKKIRSLSFHPVSTNTHDMTVKKGASNGFTGFDGSGSFSVCAHAGGSAGVYDGGNGVAVSASVKTLDFAGNGTEAVYVGITGGT